MEYRTKPVGTDQSHVVVIHCSDPRYQPHFQNFLYSGLGLNRYGLIAIPGGPEHLSPSERSDALRSQGAAWFDFMSKLMDAERCILIGHADCRWYIANHIESDESRLKDHVRRDLLAARDWPAFARAYNGPGYRKNRYDDKLRRAYDVVSASLG